MGKQSEAAAAVAAAAVVSASAPPHPLPRPVAEAADWVGSAELALTDQSESRAGVGGNPKP
jgi:hypothetical protein